MQVEMFDTQTAKRQNPLEFLAYLWAREREAFRGNEYLRDFDQHSLSDRSDDRSNR